MKKYLSVLLIAALFLTPDSMNAQDGKVEKKVEKAGKKIEKTEKKAEAKVKAKVHKKSKPHNGINISKEHKK